MMTILTTTTTPTKDGKSIMIAQAKFGIKSNESKSKPGNSVLCRRVYCHETLVDTKQRGPYLSINWFLFGNSTIATININSFFFAKSVPEGESGKLQKSSKSSKSLKFSVNRRILRRVSHSRKTVVFR